MEELITRYATKIAIIGWGLGMAGYSIYKLKYAKHNTHFTNLTRKRARAKRRIKAIEDSKFMW